VVFYIGEREEIVFRVDYDDSCGVMVVLSCHVDQMD
jgi:hypothetical protein